MNRQRVEELEAKKESHKDTRGIGAHTVISFDDIGLLNRKALLLTMKNRFRQGTKAHEYLPGPLGGGQGGTRKIAPKGPRLPITPGEPEA